MTGFANVQQLEDALSEPTPEVIEALGKLDGDILVLGAGGKIGPSLARMAKRASDAAGASRRVIGVDTFPSARAAIEAAIGRRRDDPLRPAGPGAARQAAGRAERGLHGRHEVRRDRPGGAHVGDERVPAGDGVPQVSRAAGSSRSPPATSTACTPVTLRRLRRDRRARTPWASTP